MKKTLLIFSLFALLLPNFSQASPAESRLRGKILLQVEENGEAWYVLPDNGRRLYMKDGEAAYSIMRFHSLGISNNDLAKIPVGFHDGYGTLDGDNDGDGVKNFTEEALGLDPTKVDSDGDGYNDREELESGNNPLGPGKASYDYSFANRLKGKILLQVEQRGEAWYINPDDGKRYYMKNGVVAYKMMRFMSLGISNRDLDKIDVDSNSVLPVENQDDLVNLYQNEEYGISFQYSNTLGLRVQQEGRKFYICDNKDNCSQYVEVFYKDESQKLTEAIEEDFLEDYSPGKCWAVFNQEEGTTKKAVIGFQDNLDRPGEPWWVNAEYCPDGYTTINGLSYFYTDTSFPDRYVFFQIGQDVMPAYDNIPWNNTFKFSEAQNDGWQTYNSDYNFSIRYPSGWEVLFEDDLSEFDYSSGKLFHLSFGNGTHGYGYDGEFFVDVYDQFKAEVKNPIESIGDQFDDRQETSEEIMVNGMLATKTIITSSSNLEWIYEVVVIEDAGGDYAYFISNGAIKNDRFDTFYNSFKIK